MTYLKQNMKTTTITHATTTVGSGSTAILSANPARNMILLVNDSDEDIYVAFDGSEPLVGEGVRLNANGGAILLDRVVPTSAINAICTSGSKDLLVTEG